MVSKIRRFDNCQRFLTYTFALLHARASWSHLPTNNTSFIPIIETERPHLIIETQSSKARCFCLSLLWQMFYIIYPHVLVYLWWTAYSLQPAVEIAPLSTVVTLIPILWLHWRPHPIARKTNSPDHFLENMFRAGGRLSLKKLSLWCMWQGRGNIIWNPHVSLS